MKNSILTLISVLCSLSLSAQKLTNYPLANAIVFNTNQVEKFITNPENLTHTMRFQSQDSVVYAVENGNIVQDVTLENNHRIVIQKVNDSIYVACTGLKANTPENLKNQHLLAKDPFSVAEKNADGLYEISITLFNRTNRIKVENEPILP